MEGTYETSVTEVSSNSGYSGEVAAPVVETTPPVQETSPAPEFTSPLTAEQSPPPAEIQPEMETPEMGLEAEDDSMDDFAQEISASAAQEPVEVLEPEDDSVSVDETNEADDQQQILEPEDDSVDDSTQEVSASSSPEPVEALDPAQDPSFPEVKEKAGIDQEVLASREDEVSTSEKAYTKEQPYAEAETVAQQQLQPERTEAPSNVEVAARKEMPTAANDDEPTPSMEADTTNKTDPAAETGKEDVSERYKYSEFARDDGTNIKQVSGQLGVPGQVETHRDEYQQRKMSGGSGDHASHLVGDQFGPRGDATNLSSGNQHINLNSYKNLESSWANSIKDGSQIDVSIKDVTNPDQARPFMRNVKWSETDAGGVKADYELDFANTHSPESRLRQDIAPTVPEGTNAEIIDLSEVRKNKQG